MNLKTPFLLLKESFAQWQKDKAPVLAAALTYYTVFSIAPLLIIAIAIAGFIFGEEAARGQLVERLEAELGTSVAQTIQMLVVNISRPQSGIIATVLGVCTIFWGASSIFTHLKNALNTIWNVSLPPKRGVMALVADRLLSLFMVLGVGLLLILFLTVSAVLAAANEMLSDRLNTPEIVWHQIDFLVSFLVMMVLFACMFKFLPDVKIAWGDVWIGAAITAILFTIGKILIGFYLGKSTVASAYGIAGSFVILLLWINYSAQILFFGAEFTQVWANRYGSRIVYKERGNLKDKLLQKKRKDTPPEE